MTFPEKLEDSPAHSVVEYPDFILSGEMDGCEVDLQKWIVEAGTFDILIGSSSRDIRLTGEVEW